MTNTTQEFNEQAESNRVTQAQKLAILSNDQKHMLKKLEDSIVDNKEQHKELLLLVTKMGDKIDNSTNKINEAMKLKADLTTVEKLEGNQRWVVITIIGALIVAGLNLIIK